KIVRCPFTIPTIGGEGQINCEARTFSRTGTLSTHAAAVQFHQVTNHRQTKTQATGFPRYRSFLLSKAMKNEGKKLRGYAVAVVANDQTHERTQRCCRKRRFQ